MDEKVAKILAANLGYSERGKYTRLRIADSKPKILGMMQQALIWENAARGTKKPFIQPSNEVLDIISQWCEDNHGKGLLLCGKTGVGKTLLLDCVRTLIQLSTDLCLPKLSAEQFLREHERFTTPQSNARLVYIDDLGREPKSQVQTYGNIASPIDELFDRIENEGVLLLATSNYNPTGRDGEKTLATIYGDRVMSRMFNNLVLVGMSGEDLRRRK